MVTDELLPLPPVPIGVREAAQRGTLIPFVGAGASRLAGCPGWAEFAENALRWFVENGKLSYAQYDQLRNQHPRVKLSLVRALQEEHGIRVDFRKLLHPSGWRDHAKGRLLYGHIAKLGKTFVTTNYDEWLDEEVLVPTLTAGSAAALAEPSSLSARAVVHKVRDLTAANLNQPNTVVHLHGSLLDPDGMILTTQDYVRHYANDRFTGEEGEENRVLTFLQYLFMEKTVLFVGYGLEELEILEYVILKARRVLGVGKPEAKHYLLQGFFSHEDELMRSLRRYYLDQCGIELIPFLRDRKDWDQLLDVLDAFARQAPASVPMYLQEFKEMEGLLNG